MEGVLDNGEWQVNGEEGNGQRNERGSLCGICRTDCHAGTFRGTSLSMLNILEGGLV